MTVDPDRPRPFPLPSPPSPPSPAWTALSIDGTTDLVARADNILTVTGKEDDVETFKANAMGIAPEGLAFLPRGLAFLSAGPPLLSFQRLCPVPPSPIMVEARAMLAWGSTTDAYDVSVAAGRPRKKGRCSVIYEFATGGHAPLEWLAAAAERHPALQFGLKYALPHEPSACELEYQRGRRIFVTGVPYQAHVWHNKIGKEDLFTDLKSLLRLPDGRVPLKRKLKVLDVEAMLHGHGEYARALRLLSLTRGWGESATANASRYAKLFQTIVLPEFVGWLYSAQGRKRMA